MAIFSAAASASARLAASGPMGCNGERTASVVSNGGCAWDCLDDADRFV
jgi:hypothetical protein